MSSEIVGTAPVAISRYYFARVTAPFSVAQPAIVADLERRAIRPYFDGGFFGRGTEAWSVRQTSAGISTVFAFEVTTPMPAEVCAYNIAQACLGIGVTPSHVAILEPSQEERSEMVNASRPALLDFGTLPSSIPGAIQSGSEAVQAVAKVPLYLALLGVVGFAIFVYSKAH